MVGLSLAWFFHGVGAPSFRAFAKGVGIWNAGTAQDKGGWPTLLLTANRFDHVGGPSFRAVCERVG
jgi:hypothetical protein